MNIGKFFLEIIFSSYTFSSASLSELDARNAITINYFKSKISVEKLKKLTLHNCPNCDNS